MVRLIGDNGMLFYVKDFAVVPEYQSKGIGKFLIENIEKYIKESVGEGAVSLELISTIETQAFYEKMGFESRPGDGEGPGMFKMIR